MTMWDARDHDVIRVPENKREAVRWALKAVPPCVVLGLAAGWVIGRWWHR